MKIATLDLTPSLLVEFSKACGNQPFARRFIVRENPLPDDAEIVRIGLADDGLEPRTLRLYIKSESFAEVGEHVEPPSLPLVIFETVFEKQEAV